MKKIMTAFLTAVLSLTILAFCSAEDSGVLLTLEDGEAIPAAPYSLYLEVADGISRYNTRQGIAFTVAMESYLSANNVILATDDFMQTCGDDINTYLDSDLFALCIRQLEEHCGMDKETVLRCVMENYWSQYVASQMSGFFHAQSEMNGEDAEEMFNEFKEDFYKNVEFTDDAVVVFAGETLPWSDLYCSMCNYDALTARLEVVDSIAVNRSIEKFLEQNGIGTDLSQLEQSEKEAVTSMRANEIYSRVFDQIMAEKNCAMDDFLVAMRPFVTANFERASFGRYCYMLYQAESSATGPDSSAVEEYYNNKLSEVTQTYTIGNLW